jgi:peroxiredoxin
MRQPSSPLIAACWVFHHGGRNLSCAMFRSMRSVIPALIATVLMAGSAQAAPQLGSEPADFAARALEGGNYRLSEYRGEVVVLLFWGSWCGDCRPLLNDVDRLWRTYASAGLMAVGVNLDEKPAAASNLVRAAGVQFPSIRDVGKRISRSFDVDALPMVVLLDRSGRVRFVASGPRSGDIGTTDMVRRLLDE